VAHPFNRLLLATEHTDFDVGAEAIAFALARRCGLGLAAVLPIVSNPEFEAVAPELAARADAEAARRAEGVEAAAAAQGVALALEVRHGAEPYEEIVAEARERAADLVIIRRRGKRGFLANLMFGEMVGKVVAHAPCSVLMCPRAATMWRRRVLVGVDPQAPDAALVDTAARVAGECGIGLAIVGVAAAEAARAAAEAAIRAAAAQALALGVAAEGEVRTGRPHEQLVAAARLRGADLIVVGRRSHHGPERAWIGGSAQKVIGLAEGPVLVHIAGAS
jgi:nucleotide-binding universal stress UspA family protein